MDRYPNNQPNGILPRPPPPQQPRAQMIPDDSDDDDEFGGSGDHRPPPVAAPQIAPVNVPRPSSRSRNARDSRSSSRDKEPSSSVLEQASSLETPRFLKIAVIGDSTVGKSCICQAVTLDSYTFNKNYQLTCGVRVCPKSVKIPDGSEDDRVNMALLDSSGKDIYLEYLPKYWEKLDGFCLVIDIVSTASLNNASEWIKLVMGSCHNASPAPLGILLGNKMDLSDRRTVSAAEAQAFATKHNLQYFECSVKESSGLEEPFFYLAHKWNSFSLDKENVSRN